jgi:predicted glycoside hydrolase/deacetylase ChbG (UPF0249 family)
MAGGPAFDDAIRTAHAHPTLGIGCHIVLTDGTPISPPETIPTLLGPNRKTFRASLSTFFRDALFGRIAPADIAREAQAQIDRIQQQGIRLTHIDTHKHTHIFPAVARPLLHLAECTSIGAIRNPFEPQWTSSLGHGGILRRLVLRLVDRLQPRFRRIPQIHHAHVLTTDGTFGISATGQLNTRTLTETLNALPAEGVFELCCHPGYNDRDLDAVNTRLRGTRDIERIALLKAIPQILSQPNAPELIHYGTLGSHGALRELGRFQPNTGYEKVL